MVEIPGGLLEAALKAVFDIRPTLKYDSDLCRRFRFQGRMNYLEVAEACVGDWIIFRETKAGGGHGAYVAVAFVTGILPDAELRGFYNLTFSDYLLLDEPVSIRVNGRYAETRLVETRRPNQIGSVLQGQAMRSLYDADFHFIVRTGFGLSLQGSSLAEGGLAPWCLDASGNETITGESKREASLLRSRPFRDEVIRRQVGIAYDFTCAVTRTRNTDGKGRYEAQCAHVWSLSDHGPDIVQNCMAFAGTAHWLFDNYVFTINPDFTLRISPGLVDPAYLRLFPARGERIALPKNERLWPHARFLDHHRAEFHRRRA